MSARGILPLVIAGTVAVSATAAPSTQAIRTRFDPGPLTEWLKLVQSHEPGRVDAAATTVSRSSPSELRTIVNDVAGLAQTVRALPAAWARFKYRNFELTRGDAQQMLGLTDDEAARGDATRFLKLGLVMHTDIARFMTVASLPTSPGTTRLDDGAYSGTESMSPHWDIARLLLRGMSSPATDGTVRRWYRAMTADSIRARDWSLTLAHLDRGLQQIPDDPRLLLHAGVTREALGSDDVQDAVALLNPMEKAKIGVRAQSAELRDAERFLRRAIEADPDLAEARLRLGHVLGQLGRHDDAVQELRRAAAGTTQPVLRYYAMLVLGREESVMARHAEAQTALAEAMRIFPLAQTPLLAECQLARRLDAQDRVLSALRRLEQLPPDRDARHDPWWDYDTYASRDADKLITEFYAEFRGGPVK